MAPASDQTVGNGTLFSVATLRRVAETRGRACILWRELKANRALLPSIMASILQTQRDTCASSELAVIGRNRYSSLVLWHQKVCLPLYRFVPLIRQHDELSLLAIVTT
jgi:hypothetical protein